MSELRDFDRANELQVEVQKITISELQKRIAELETQVRKARRIIERVGTTGIEQPKIIQLAEEWLQ